MDAYRDQYATVFKGGKGIVLLAISVDPAAELASWAKDRGYPFRFLTDPEGAVGKRYGVFEPGYKMDNRTVYVVGPDGRITHVAAPFQEIDPKAYDDLRIAIEAAGR
jgi:peroxiredoxin Q/BCP